jgi:glycosyltransferase involved in cell wall biosynthesis
VTEVLEQGVLPPLRVVLAPSAYYPHVGGIEELTRQLALSLRARGHEVAVLTNRWPEGVLRSEVIDGIAVTRLRFPLPAGRPAPAARFLGGLPPAALELVRHVRRWRPDVVHVIGAGPQCVYLAAFRRLLGSRLAFTAQGELTFDAHGAFERSAALRAGLRQALRNADVVTACSEFVMHGLAEFGEIRAPSLVIPNGVQPSDFVGATPATEPGPYVLGVGRLVPQKGFDVLMEALASDELAELNLVLAGEGFERDRLQARARELGIDSRVRFAGAVDRSRVAELLRGAHLFAFPSRGEPFGIALLEAMAAGAPSVATAAGGVPEFARDGENALLVEPGDPKALAAAIARLAFDAQLRYRVITGGIATAKAHAWGRIAAHYEEIYCGAPRGPDS